MLFGVRGCEKEVFPHGGGGPPPVISFRKGGLMKKGVAKGLIFLFSLLLLWPGFICAAGGGEATEIVVVADTRIIQNSILRYFADTYNADILVFAIWSVVLTALYGVILGVLMDWIMSKTGLDLKSRTIVEH
jgi:ABC-type Fe3+ transport system permease subunit